LLSSLTLRDGKPLAGRTGEVALLRTAGTDGLAGSAEDPVDTPHVVLPDGDGEDGGILVKILRRINEGINPEWELGEVLTDAGFSHGPVVLGALEYRQPGHNPVMLAVLQQFVPNQGTAWAFTLDVLARFVEEGLAQGLAGQPGPMPTAGVLLAAADADSSPPVPSLVEPYLDFARLLGRRTANLHMVLAHIPERPEFVPEPFTSFAQRSLYQSMRGLTAHTLRSLRHMEPSLGEEARADAGTILASEPAIHDRFAAVLRRSLTGSRIRSHGDYHLEQVLRTPDGLVLVDFEGEPDRHLDERRLRSSPLRDVAGMLHSLMLAAMTIRMQRSAKPEDQDAIDGLLTAWYRWSGAVFLEAYQEEVNGDSYLPETVEERATLLDTFLLEKAVYEVGYTIDHRPDQVPLALRILVNLLEPGGTSSGSERRP
jgi:maltose alpha-D-glucosyltransferase/alpha-amylase